jgi:hypothetical protein
MNSKSKSKIEPTKEQLSQVSGKETALGCLGIIVLFLFLALLGWIFELTGVNTDGDSGSKKDETTYVKTDFMPNAVGMTYAEALDKDAKFYDDHYYPDYIDLIEDRSVWDNENWVVIAQSPQPGTLVEPDQRICFGLVKIEETNEFPKILQCWQNVYESTDITDSTFDFIQKDLLKIDSTNKELIGYFLKVSVEIDLSDGSSLDLDYCSNKKFGIGGSMTDELDLDTFRTQDNSYDLDTFDNWFGDYRYRIKGVSKNLGSGCFSY